MEPSISIGLGDARSFVLKGDQDETCPLQPYRTRVSSDFEPDQKRPRSRFDFLDTVQFQALVTVVILSNIVLVAVEITADVPKELCSVLDQTILAFYTAELLCRVLRSGCPGFFLEQERLWNLMDLVIVALGLAETYILPLFHVHAKTFYIAGLRMLRTLRAFKLIRVFSQLSLGWTDTEWFQWIASSVIALNAVVLGFETDYPSPAWWWVNQGMLMFFVFEIAVRIKLDGCKSFFFACEEDLFWNWTDFIIVLLGVVDLWALEIARLFVGKDMETTGLGRLMLVVRMLRMMRILRLLKLVKAVRPLYSLALGVTQAMQSIFWVLVLLLVTLYAFAILATRLIGHAEAIKEDKDLPLATRELFSSICNSLFALFSVMNQQNWAAIEPLLQKMPGIKPVYVLFMICSSWALLSVLTGVVSDNMMSVREAQAQKDEEAQEERRQWLTRWLRGIFASADKDGTGALDRNEYRNLLKSPFHLKKLQQVARVPMQDLAQMFDLLDIDGNGVVEFEEFLTGFEWLNDPITGKSLLKVGHEARSSCLQLEELLGMASSDLNQLKLKQEEAHEKLRCRLHEVLTARKQINTEAAQLGVEKEKVYEAAKALASLREDLKSFQDEEYDSDSGLPTLSSGDESPPKVPGRWQPATMDPEPDEVIQTPVEEEGFHPVRLTTRPNWMRDEVRPQVRPQEPEPDEVIQTPVEEEGFHPVRLTTRPNWMRDEVRPREPDEVIQTPEAEAAEIKQTPVHLTTVVNWMR